MKYVEQIMAGMTDRDKRYNLISMCLIKLLFSVLVFCLVVFFLSRVLPVSTLGSAGTVVSGRVGVALISFVYISIGLCCFSILKNGFPMLCMSFPMMWEALLKLWDGRKGQESQAFNMECSGPGGVEENNHGEEESIEQRILNFIRGYKQVKVIPLVFLWLQRNGSLRGETRDDFRRYVYRATGVKVSGSHMSQTISDLNAILDKDDRDDAQVKVFLRIGEFLKTIVAPGEAFSLGDKTSPATEESRISPNDTE